MQLCVLQPGSRQPAQSFPDFAGRPDPRLHPPLGYHGLAACTGGSFHRDDETIPAEHTRVLLVLGSNLKACRQAAVNLRRAGTGGSAHPDVPAEFSGIPHDRGTIGAARSSNPNSANSQFFINFKDNHFLNRQYTVYGRVISGMEHVDAIVRGEPPANPDRMITVRVAADVA